MAEHWTGNLIGRMHNHGVTRTDLGAELGVSDAYISMILNGKRNPIGAQHRLEEAFRRIVERKRELEGQGR